LAGVPVIYCKPGERKHLIAGQYLAARQPATGVFLVLVAKAMAPVWKAKRSDRGPSAANRHPGGRLPASDAEQWICAE
jgi:hypothetical protein